MTKEQALEQLNKWVAEEKLFAVSEYGGDENTYYKRRMDEKNRLILRPNIKKLLITPDIEEPFNDMVAKGIISLPTVYEKRHGKGYYGRWNDLKDGVILEFKLGETILMVEDETPASGENEQQLKD